VYNIKDYGAAGVAFPKETLKLTHLRFKWLEYEAGLEAVIYHCAPGREYDSVGIQKAIDAAHAAGGGTVRVPAGNYLIGPIELKSRVHLHLEAGARLWGSPLLADYEAPAGSELPPYSHECSFMRESDRMNRKRRLISAALAEDVAITGMGQISGQSCAFVIPWMNTAPAHGGGLKRPSDTFVFHRCERVKLEGIRILDTPSWSVVFDACRDVQIRGLQIRGFDVINSDGIDLVDTSNVTISDCDFHVTDDVICLKSVAPDHTMSNIVVSNCVIRTLCNAVKIGTDTAGNFEDITVSNLVIYNRENDPRGGGKGINLAAIDGGRVRNINISNVVMRNVACAFYLVGGCRTVQQQAFRTPRPGRMEGITLSNIRADGTKYTSFVSGHPGEPICDVHLSNIHIRKRSDFYLDPPVHPVPELPEAYPSPVMFGSLEEGDQLPASGLYLRHAARITVRDFDVECLEADIRETVVEDQCTEVVITGLRTRLVGDRDGAPAGVVM
jgi:polygalacturonase